MTKKYETLGLIVESKSVLETPSLTTDQTRKSWSGPGEDTRSYWKSYKEGKKKISKLREHYTTSFILH